MAQRRCPCRRNAEESASCDDLPVLLRRETPADIADIRRVTTRAFARDDAPEPVEAPLVDQLRADAGWIPQLSLVADVGGVVGHVVCTRAVLGGQPVLGLGPLSVDPPYQGRGVGSALMHAILGAADARDESLVVLLGSPRYYGRFGFVAARDLGIVAPDAHWGDAFQARPLTTYTPSMRGRFDFAEPFQRL